MKISYLIFLTLFILNLFVPAEAIAVKQHGKDSVVTGIDINGNEASCLKMEQPLYCSMEVQAGDIHGLECRSRGFNAVQCGCHDFVCVEYETESVVGFDRQGMKRTCVPMEEGATCTEIFTEDEAFAERCQEKGGVAIACGCHDYICVKN